MKIAIHGRNISVDSVATVTAIIAFLESQGAELFMYRPFATFLENQPGINHKFQTYCHTAAIPEGTKFMISLGGDGTFLDAARFVRDRGIPLLGINMGRLGFLAYISEDEALSALAQIISGDYVIEDRSVLNVSGSFLSPKHYPFALNEVTVQRKGSALIKATVEIDGELLSSYWSDGLIIATPTGSTAYAMSVGGPIVSPDTSNLTIQPIAPHNLSIRPIVISDSSLVTVRVETRVNAAMITMDNQMFDIESGTEFNVRKSTFTIKLVKLPNSSFYRILRNKLLWGFDPRN